MEGRQEAAAMEVIVSDSEDFNLQFAEKMQASRR